MIALMRAVSVLCWHGRVSIYWTGEPITWHEWQFDAKYSGMQVMHSPFFGDMFFCDSLRLCLGQSWPSLYLTRIAPNSRRIVEGSCG